jgi:colanic acid/amylovoran biosynthesis glycosyltransferase
LKVVLFLNSYPKLSEPFIDSFLGHIEKEHEIYLITQIIERNANKSKFRVLPYLNFKGYGFLKKLKILFKIVFHFDRYLALRRKGVNAKQLISDAGFWTISKLDYVHFPFANLAFGREHYAEVVDAKMTISFRGSDLNVYPIYHGLTYKSILEKCTKIHCNSIELKAKLEQHQFVQFDKVSIIHSAIRFDYQLFDGEIHSIVDKRVYQIEKFVTIGRLHWVKDYAFTFEALGKLKAKGHVFEYKIIGDGPELEHLMFLAHFYSISDNVIFFGAKNASEIKNELQNSTLYLQSSLAEGFSNACLEAQSQGLMCVVTDVSGMSACIENQVTGIVLKERKPQLMADSIIEIMNLPISERKQREIYTSNRVFEKFSQQIQRKDWLNFFKN